jgi:hypothetical protein
MNTDPTIAARLAEARARLKTRGWTERDLAAFERRHRRNRDREPGIHDDQLLLAMYNVLPPMPEVSTPADHGVDAAMLAKVRALLAKAESTTFPAEAEALSAKAQELMTRYRIDAVLVDGGAGGPRMGPGGRRIWVEDPYARPKASLLSAVARANGCQAVRIGVDGCVHLVGYDADLEAVELLFTSLLVQVGSAMVAAGPQVDWRGRSRTRSFRHSFLLAYGWRVGERLEQANATTASAVDAERGGDLLPMLRRRDVVVSAAVDAAFPNLRRRRPSSAISNAAGWGAGVDAADRADLATAARVPSGPRGAIGR